MPAEHLFRFNQEPTTIWHGIPRIHRKMKQDLFESFAIGLDIHRRIFNDYA
jgi:hypothetical protein